MAQPSSMGFKNKVIAADTVLNYQDVTYFGRFVATTGGIRITMPDAINALGNDLWEFVVDNEASTPVLVKGDFAGGKTGILLAPGARLWGQYVPKMGAEGFEIRYMAPADAILGESGTYQQTLVWGAGGANDITKAGYWAIVDGVLWLWGFVTTADGNGDTLTSIALPSGIIPPNCGIEVPINAVQTIDGTPTEALGYLDCSSATAATRQVITFRGASAFTNAKTSTMRYFGFVPLDLTKWTSISVAETWATGTPGSITEAAYRKLIGDICFVVGQWTSADSTGATNIVIPLPVPSQDLDAYMPGRAIQKTVDGSDVSSYVNPLLLLDLANNTEASRVATCQNFTTATDNKAIQVSVAFAYPAAVNHAGWTSFDADPTYTQDGTILTDPVTNVVEKGYWSASSGLLAFLIYQSADDGNDCTAVLNALPMKPAGLLTDIPLSGYQYQHTDTKRNPLARLDVTDERIECDLLHKLDNTEATKLYIGGVFPIC